MTSKREKGVGALTSTAFNRLVRGARTNLTGIRAQIVELLRDHPRAFSRIAAFRGDAAEEYSTFLQRVEGYMEADPLPESLSQDQVLEGVQQIKTLHQQISQLLAGSSPDIAPPASRPPGGRLPQISLPQFDGDFRIICEMRCGVLLRPSFGISPWGRASFPSPGPRCVRLTTTAISWRSS